MKNDTNIAKEWHGHALKIKQDANKIILGQEKAINLVIISLFARGHVLQASSGGLEILRTTCEEGCPH